MEKFSALLALGEGNPPVTCGFPSHKPVTRSFDDFFDLRLNKQLSKQSRRRRFETPSRSLWRRRNQSSYAVYDICRHNDDTGRVPYIFILSYDATSYHYIDGLGQGRRKSSALGMTLRLSCTYPSVCECVPIWVKTGHPTDSNTVSLGAKVTFWYWL